jgi:hypothetical protein
VAGFFICGRFHDERAKKTGHRRRNGVNEVTMKTQRTIQTHQLEKFARFLEIHPGFYPELEEENAMVCGFHVGGCFLAIADMDMIISSQPRQSPSVSVLMLTTWPKVDKKPV